MNQEDIASIDVLKDASAGAIYGTRATGGVILVTTKQAKEGPMRLSYTGEVMFETTRKQLDVLSADEFVDAGLGTDYGHQTDWFDLITRTPVTNRHVLTMSGGSANSRIYTSFSYQDMQGLAIEDSRRITTEESTPTSVSLIISWKYAHTRTIGIWIEMKQEDHASLNRLCC